MSRYTYAGEFRNPAASFRAVENPDGDGYIVGVSISVGEILQQLIAGEIKSEEANTLRARGWRPHSKGLVFDEPEDADEWIEGIEQAFEDDYDDYLEENRYELAQMERYEQWRNEY